MKMYGVTLSALSVDEKEKLLDEIKKHSFMSPDMIMGKKSGVLEAVIVFWNEPAFPGLLEIPPCCSFKEIPAGYQYAFAANF